MWAGRRITELAIARTPCNGFGNILYNMINQGLGFPILLTDTRVLLEIFLVLFVWVWVGACGVCEGGARDRNVLVPR